MHRKNLNIIIIKLLLLYNTKVQIILVWIIIFSIFGSVGAILAASLFITLKEETQKLIIPLLLSFATGTLLAAALIGMIPEAIEASGEPHDIMPYVLGGILFFFFLEKIIIWRNCQDETCEVHGPETAGPIILLGDAMHNFTDGIVIAAAFLTEFHLGVIAGLTILCHEIPQETGDFGILLSGGFSKKKAFGYNLLSSSTTIPAAIISYFVLGLMSSVIPYLLAISAASFIYIALTDLAPELHEKIGHKHLLYQFILILAGIALMVFLIMFLGHNH